MCIDQRRTRITEAKVATHSANDEQMNKNLTSNQSSGGFKFSVVSVDSKLLSCKRFTLRIFFITLGLYHDTQVIAIREQERILHWHTEQWLYIEEEVGLRLKLLRNEMIMYRQISSISITVLRQ